MGWRLTNKPQTVKVTRKLAQEFADMDSVPRERPLSERRLLVYNRILNEGGFRPVSWARATVLETGDTYRVNGQHTSHMLAKKDPMPEFYAVVEDYECDTLEDLAHLYATYDSSTQSRTARDIYLSFASTVPALREVGNQIIGLAASGMAMYFASGDARGEKLTTAADKAELLLEHPEFVIWLSRVLSADADGKPRSAKERQEAKHLRRQPVVAAMMATWQKAQKASTDFWAAVRDESDHPADKPTRKLAKYLSHVGVDSGSGAKRLKSVPPREMFVKCLHAWNAWRRDESTNLNYYQEADVPRVL